MTTMITAYGDESVDRLYIVVCWLAKTNVTQTENDKNLSRHGKHGRESRELGYILTLFCWSL